MPATHQIDNTDKLLITTWTGKATDAKLIDALKKYQENYLCHPDYIITKSLTLVMPLSFN